MPLVQGMVEWSTRGGEKPAAQMSQELNWYMQEGLEEAGMLILEEAPTTLGLGGPLKAVHDHNVPCAVCYA